MLPVIATMVVAVEDTHTHTEAVAAVEAVEAAVAAVEVAEEAAVVVEAVEAADDYKDYFSKLKQIRIQKKETFYFPMYVILFAILKLKPYLFYPGYLTIFHTYCSI